MYMKIQGVFFIPGLYTAKQAALLVALQQRCHLLYSRRQ